MVRYMMRRVCQHKKVLSFLPFRTENQFQRQDENKEDPVLLKQDEWLFVEMGRGLRQNSMLLYIIVVVLLCIIALLLNGKCDRGSSSIFGSSPEEKFSMVRKRPPVYDRNLREYEYGQEMPLIFIGGVPRSGTTLMRAMLDAHPLVRCGEETRVIPRILGMRAQWKKSKKEAKRLEEAGISDSVLDNAISAFVLEVIARHGIPAPRLCNKDPFTLKSTEYLSSLFPKAKFVLMIRDGRATVHSIMSRKITITGFDLNNHRQCLEKWNAAMTAMYHQCYTVGEERCFPMYYEQLVLHPEKWMKELLKFLELPWNSSVLNHEMFIGNKISLSKVERSSDQVIKPVNTDALTKWVGHYPQDVVDGMAKIAPMLAHLGYDPNANPPDYGKADDFVARKTADLHNKEGEWNERIAKLLKTSPPNKQQLQSQKS